MACHATRAHKSRPAQAVFFFSIELAARRVRWHDRRAPGAFHLFFPFSPDSTLFPDVPNPSASKVAANGVGTSLVRNGH